MTTKTTIKSKAMSILLALTVLLGMLPIPVFTTDAAADTGTAPVYVALGDSISTGYGLESPSTEGFASLVANGGYSLTNLAVNGNTANGILAQLATDEIKAVVSNAELITITCGGNDLMNALYQAIADDYNASKGTQFTGADVLNELADGTSTDMSFGFAELGRLMMIVTNFTTTDAFTKALQSYKNAMYGTTGETVTMGVIDTILTLNPDVTIVLTTQYNPYIVFKTDAMYGNLYKGIEAGAIELNKVITDNASGKYIVADVYTAFTENTNNLCNAQAGSGMTNLDFHPNAEGHKVIADTVSAALVNADAVTVEATISVMRQLFPLMK